MLPIRLPKLREKDDNNAAGIAKRSLGGDLARHNKTMHTSWQGRVWRQYSVLEARVERLLEERGLREEDRKDTTEGRERNETDDQSWVEVGGGEDEAFVIDGRRATQDHEDTREDRRAGRRDQGVGGTDRQGGGRGSETGRRGRGRVGRLGASDRAGEQAGGNRAGHVAAIAERPRVDAGRSVIVRKEVGRRFRLG